MNFLRLQKGVFLAALFAVFLFSGCTNSQEKNFDHANKLVEEKNYSEALKYFEYVIKRDGETSLAEVAARDGARVAFFDAKDFKKAIFFYQHLVIHSASSDERIRAQKAIAEIYFDELQEYEKAVIEFSKLLQMPHPDHELAEYKISIARAHYYLNNFFQSESEINEILRLKISDDIKFRSLVLLGDILMAQKNYARAITLYQDLMKNYPVKAAQENVSFALAVCFEETEKFKEAIQILEPLIEKYQPREYIELRIKRLNVRLKNQPGAKGFRK